MRKTVSCIATAALCGLGFAVGRISLTHPSTAFESATRASVLLSDFQPPDQPMDEEMAAMMEKMEAAGRPGPHHDALKPLAGNWEGFVEITMAPGQEPMKMPATISREWIMDGRFMKEAVKSETDDGPFNGMGLVGFNNVDGVYESMWVDNTGTAILTETGTYDVEKKTFRFYSSHRDPASGKLNMGHVELDLSNPNRHVMTGWRIGPDGKAFKSFYGVFERVK